MKTSAILLFATLGMTSASVLSTTNVATVLAGVTAPSSLTISADAMVAITKLGTGGANAASLTAAETAAISACTEAGRANNTASKANLSDGTGSAGAIAFVTNKVTTHACETAGQQIALVTSGKAASDTDVNLLISNVGVLNVNTKAAGITSKRAVAIVILAHYYTIALVVEPLFPEVGAAYFGSLSLGPIEEIARRLFSINVSQTSDSNMQTPLHLMEYPIDMVSMFRSRMGWVQPERTASFPTFSHHSYGMEDNFNTISPYGNPAFTYSQEHIMTMPPDPISAAAIPPLSLDPYTNHYLGIPSPSGFGGYHSPASSNFGEGSTVYSEHGEDFALYEGQGSGSNFGGTTTSSFQFEPRSSADQIKVEHADHMQQHMQHLPQFQPYNYHPHPIPHSQYDNAPMDPKGKNREL